MKKVEDLFNVDVFKNVKVVAGHKGVTRIVESIEISETPDVINYLAENSLLLTTGFAYKEYPKGLCSLISQMSEYPCAGLAIKLKRFIDELPQEVIDLANSLDFPIIQIPSSFTLGEVFTQLTSFIWSDKTEELIFAIQAQKRFTEMMLKGYDLQLLLENLGYFLHCPILLLNPYGDAISYTQHFHRENLRNVVKNIEAFFKSNIEEYREKTKLYFTNPYANQTPMCLNIFQVNTMHPNPFLLIIVNPGELPYPSSQLAIEQASTVISFTLLKNEAINESSRLLENNFFGSLVDGNITSKQEIIHRGKIHGLINEGKYLCIVCKNDEDKRDSFSNSDEGKRNSFSNSDVSMNKTYNFLYELLFKSAREINDSRILFMKDEYFVLLIQTTEKFDEGAKDIIREKIKTFQQNAQKRFKIPLSIGVGNFVNDVTNIPISYSEATEAYKQGAKLYSQNFINFYETKELTELIRLIPEENLQEFYENTLRSLAYPKTRDEEELINTLIVYLDEFCEITRTSKKLYVHRNTVKYRIAKCEEILSYSVHESQNSLNLRVALLMRPLFT